MLNFKIDYNKIDTIERDERIIEQVLTMEYTMRYTLFSGMLLIINYNEGKIN